MCISFFQFWPNLKFFDLNCLIYRYSRETFCRLYNYVCVLTKYLLRGLLTDCQQKMLGKQKKLHVAKDTATKTL